MRQKAHGCVSGVSNIVADSLRYNESEIQLVSQDLTNGKGLVVSDGSFKDCHGMAAARLEGSTNHQGITVATITPGHPNV
jgi:hypothetical protein